MTLSTLHEQPKPSLRRMGSTGGQPPPESPDLNPIENLWHELKYYLETKVKPQSKQELIDGIKKFWRKKVDVAKCARSIDHVLYKAIPAVVESRGAAMKY